MVGNPEYRFSRIEAYLSVMVIFVIQFYFPHIDNLLFPSYCSKSNNISGDKVCLKHFEFIYMSIVSPGPFHYRYTSPGCSNSAQDFFGSINIHLA